MELKIYIDEAGRGPLAGPLYCGLVLNLGKYDSSKFKDSKKLTESSRENLYEEICSLEQGGKLLFSSGNSSNLEIDIFGISKCINIAICRGLYKLLFKLYSTNLQKSLEKSNIGEDKIIAFEIEKIFHQRLLKYGDEIVIGFENGFYDDLKSLIDLFGNISKFQGFIIDGNSDFGLKKDLGIQVTTIIDGDDKVPSISAASIVAKVERDRIMDDLDENFEKYGFAKHKGYGTLKHRENIVKYGISELHRICYLNNLISKFGLKLPSKYDNIKIWEKPAPIKKPGKKGKNKEKISENINEKVHDGIYKETHGENIDDNYENSYEKTSIKNNKLIQSRSLFDSKSFDLDITNLTINENNPKISINPNQTIFQNFTTYGHHIDILNTNLNKNFLEKSLVKFYPYPAKINLLVHVCCAPDLAWPLKSLQQYFKLYLFWYNPNIQPAVEYKSRYDQYIKLLELEKGDYEILEDRYDPKEFFDAMIEHKDMFINKYNNLKINNIGNKNPGEINQNISIDNKAEINLNINSIDNENINFKEGEKLEYYLNIGNTNTNTNTNGEINQKFNIKSGTALSKDTNSLHQESGNSLIGNTEKLSHGDILKKAQELGEGSSRCDPCYYFRMIKPAQVAQQKGLKFFTTTLLISPKKDLEKLFKYGLQAQEKNPGTHFLYFDFRKKDGYKKSCELTKTYGLIRQDYCGCAWSIRNN